MNFEFDKPQKDIRKAAGEFAKGEFDKELILELEKHSEFPEKIWQKAGELGFIGIHFDQEYSGGGMGITEAAIVTEEFYRKDTAIGGALLYSSYAAECILRFGSEKQRKKFIPEIIEANMLSAGAFFEESSAYDIVTSETKAVFQNDHWFVNGVKKYVPNGKSAGCYIVSCMTEKGPTMLVAESGLKGISATDSGEKLGNRLTETADVFFENAEIPAENLIGKEGRAESYIKKFFGEHMILQAAAAVGTAYAALDRTIDYVKSRSQFGKKISEFEITKHKIADMTTKAQLAKLITYRAAYAFDKKEKKPEISTMARLYAQKAAEEIVDEALQLHGGYGYIKEYEIERFYRDAKTALLFAGNPSFLKNEIAKEVL